MPFYMKIGLVVFLFEGLLVFFFFLPKYVPGLLPMRSSNAMDVSSARGAVTVAKDGKISIWILQVGMVPWCGDK